MRAVPAGAADLDRVPDIGEAIALRDVRTQPLEVVEHDLDRLAATGATEVVVVRRRTCAVSDFTAGTTDGVDQTLLGEGGEIAVHRREADAAAVLLQLRVQLLGSEKLVDAFE